MKVYELVFLLNKLYKFKVSKTQPSQIYVIRAYNNVIYKIKESYESNDSITIKDIKSLDITDTMKTKLTDLLKVKINTSDRKQIKKYQLRDDLINVAGIGKTKADELIQLGLTNINQIKQKKWQSHLNSGTLILLKYKPLTRIPHAQIKKIESKLTSFKKAKAKLVGGFLRKKPHSKDIDVMLVSDKLNILDEYIVYLNTKFPAVHIYSQGDDKISLVLQISLNGKFYKVDIFRSPKRYQHAMLLYSTGSKKFNIKMRGIAKRRGFLLNQIGLFKLPVTKGQEPIKVSSEKDIFKKLNMEYVIPTKR